MFVKFEAKKFTISTVLSNRLFQITMLGRKRRKRSQLDKMNKENDQSAEFVLNGNFFLNFQGLKWPYSFHMYRTYGDMKRSTNVNLDQLFST